MVALIYSILLNEAYSLGIFPQLNADNFCASVYWGTAFSRNEGEGLQLWGTDPEHPNKKY